MIVLSGIAIQDKIYESSNSLVYRGIRDDGSAIIIKMLKQDYPSLQELICYRQEYEITRSLNLEGVVKAYSQQDYQRTLVILLEDFGGKSLEQWMRQRSDFCPMPVSTFLRLAIKLTDILGGIHAAQVIHKDINPGNIVLNLETGVVKIIDFGIATQFSHTNPTFKSPHVLEGTLAYLSPEQTGRMNRSLDYRTDFYSLGVTFYELLTGHLPFPATDMLELVHCHIAKQPVPPREMNIAIPKPISDLILKLMAKNAEDRYQSAWGIKADLECCANQLTKTEQIDGIQLGLQDVCDRFQIPQKLYGRDREAALLLETFDRVASPEDNSEARFKVEMMLVSGYAGVGKSALVQELYKPITAKRGYFISGKFDQFQRNIPYSAITDALQKLVQQLLSEPDDRVKMWRSRLLAALGSNGQLIVDVIPEVELIIGKQIPIPEIGATEAQNRFNRIFQQFVRVFCSESHPLTIFLDDLQWIDSATLKLIELMLLDEQTQSLFLIGAYRDNEVTPTHPLSLTLSELRKQGAILQEIVLSPLALEPLSQLIAETLHQSVDTVASLADLVLRKTDGNPFFVGEFLRLLYNENLLIFDADHLSWHWNIAQIQAQSITDNVVELMLGQLKKLPEATQKILRLAACVGAEFDLETLAIVCNQFPKAVSLDLLAAIQAGLIQPLSELDEDLLVQEYKFLHDRVQQAAYALMDEVQKQVVHLQIGRNLLKKTLPERLSNRLFEIVDHFNHGIELVTDESERDEIARLNLIAGQKAKAAIAYSVAKNYLNTSMVWLTASSWKTNYDMTLAVYTETTEVAFLCGEFEQMECWAGIVLQQAKTILDTINIYEVKIQTDMVQNQPMKAINTAIQVLQQLGISFSEKTSQSEIQLELDRITSLFNGEPIGDLLHLPRMTEPDKLAAMRILSSITIAAYLAAPDLLPLLASKQVNLSIQYGNASVSSFAYANLGFVFCGMVGNIEIGYQFGQLALRLLSQLDTHSLKARILLTVNDFIIHWKEHLREIAQPLLEGYQSGLETGDLEYASYCAHTYCFQAFIVGRQLVEIEREMRTYSEAIRQIKQKMSLIWLRLLQQSVLNLIGCSQSPTSLVGEAYNEENELPQQEKLEGVILVINFLKLFLCYLFSEYTQAVESSTRAESQLGALKGAPLEPFYYLYDSLARLVTYPRSSDQTQAEILTKVAVNQEKMEHWADHAPMNFLHKYHLVEAEKARVLGQWLEAEKFYEQAIQGAKENEYVQEEALAYELAAKHYLARGLKKVAQLYMKEAHYCYERWGAMAKVKDLETRYPQLFPQSSNAVSTSVRTTTGTTSNTSNTALDLATVMKAAQAISSEIELEQLLSSLMQILIENAGAQTGYLLLENSGEWAIGAACELNESGQICATQVLRSMPMTNRLPESIIQYVIRTHETMILNDATREGNFINEPYIQHNQPKSLLCLPLLNQSQLVGVLYLENQLATGAFTPERSQVLHLLSTQAAIAIKNAKLYAKLRASESKMAQFLEAVPVAIVVVDVTGRLYYFNQRATQLLGKGIDPAITSNQISEVYQLYLEGTDREYPTEQLPGIRALSGERTRIDDVEIHQNNATIPVEVWGTPVFDEQGTVAYAIAAFQDITERKQAEKLLADYNQTLEQQVTERTLRLSQEIEERHRVENALRQSEEQRRLTMDLTHIGSWNWNIVDNTTDWNDNHARLLGLVPDKVESSYQAWRDRVHPEDIDRIEQAVTAALTTHTDFEAEYRVIYPDGNVRWLVGRGQGIYNADGQPVQMLGVILDISEQRNAALRERKRAEEASILEERNRMAREIHDTLAQSFTGILVQLGAASQVLNDDLEATQAHLEIIDELARIGLAEARRSVTALRPQLLEEGDLDSALHRLVTQMRSAADTALIYEITGTAYPLPAEVENNLLRIGQEALTNAIKYANANEIRVKLVYEATQCSLHIKDDGQGFGVGGIPVTGGFGLLGMSERAEHIGAQLTIQSQPAQGTEIIVIVNQA
ncbi:serine/threonine protein kinase [Pseudanabaena sp. SR411]|uniref:AAA family ATPase n=1 Tax=Pseudanabaena sp. SR411 TaxID=1980935 RepID=UPI000B989B7D|nr:AAA family ATPase [Pseudanabaena sp. SR411]OYQ61930.1 serine/threonine protein kinase [Pseudanabaena sp. SR411]